jgi:hypothetical protein
VDSASRRRIEFSTASGSLTQPMNVAAEAGTRLTALLASDK